jgi:DNA mismatch endonuclease (patch repair protein)
MDIMSRQQRSERMSLIRSKNTTPELIVRSLLHRLGYRFRVHKRELPGNPDVVLPSRRCAVFIDGCFWHGHKCSIGHIPQSNSEYWNEKITRTKLRDLRIRRLLKKEGWRIFVVWECEIKNTKTLTKRLTCFLDNGTNNDSKQEQQTGE